MWYQDEGYRLLSPALDRFHHFKVEIINFIPDPEFHFETFSHWIRNSARFVSLFRFTVYYRP